MKPEVLRNSCFSDWRPFFTNLTHKWVVSDSFVSLLSSKIALYCTALFCNPDNDKLRVLTIPSLRRASLYHIAYLSTDFVFLVKVTEIRLVLIKWPNVNLLSRMLQWSYRRMSRMMTGTQQPDLPGCILLERRWKIETRPSYFFITFLLINILRLK